MPMILFCTHRLRESYSVTISSLESGTKVGKSWHNPEIRSVGLICECVSVYVAAPWRCLFCIVHTVQSRSCVCLVFVFVCIYGQGEDTF